MRHPTLLRVLAGPLLAGPLVAGCADADGDDGGTSPATTTMAAATSTTDATPPAGETTVTGTVTEGVEPNCLLLEAAGGPYLLVGGDRGQLRPGARVAVTGRVDRGLLSTCQQGLPLVVASIEPAP
jgi:hypothetical protein